MSIELTDALKFLREEPRLPETLADPRRYLDDGWRFRVIEATAWEHDSGNSPGCAVGWYGYAAARGDEPGMEVGGEERFPDPGACGRVVIGADPRWVVSKYMVHGVGIATPGHRYALPSTRRPSCYSSAHTGGYRCS